MYPTVYSCCFYVFDLEDDEYIKDYSSLYHFAAEYPDPISELVNFCCNPPFPYNFLYVFIKDSEYWDKKQSGPDQVYKLVNDHWVLHELHRGEPIHFPHKVVPQQECIKDDD